MSPTHELDDDEEPSYGVYAAVSAADDRSPLDLPPLARYVDPDALDATLQSDGVRDVTLEYSGWRVSATPDAIHVEPADDA